MELDLLVIGSFYHSLGFTDIKYEKDSFIGVNNGVIVFIQNSQPAEYTFKSILQLKPDQFLVPGFVDTHIHAPQYVFTGTGYDKTLLEWLDTYTFPKESNFKDIEYAQNIYSKVVKKTLSYGTTSASYYATIHTDASVLLAKTCIEQGQRAFIGKVNMDRNSPDYYVESTSESISETERFVKLVLELENDLVTPCITPR
jgi:guanine deaminase